MTYTYDALDNRIGMDENGTQTWTLYDGSDPIMDFNGSGSLEMRYLNGPTGQLVDTVLARESSGGTIAWYLPDRLGTIRDLINNSGSIIDHVDYSAFGTVLDESSPSNGDRMMGFAGMERDTVTGMNLAVNRVQNPGTGRWTSQDPLGFAAGDTDLGRYVANRPTSGRDPLGLGPTTDPEKQRRANWMYGKMLGDLYPYLQGLPPQQRQVVLEELDELFRKFMNTEVPLQQHQCFIWCSEFLGKLKALKHLKVRFVRWEYWWFVPRFVPWFGTPPGHGAIEVTLPNGQVYYFDDWWWGYIFQPPDIPVYVNPK